MIVLDASAAIEMLLLTAKGNAVYARIGKETLHAPHLLDLEIAQVLRRAISSKQVTEQRASAALADWLNFSLNRYDHDLLLHRVWALRKNVTAYDAAYLALAEILGAPLVTCDLRLAKAPGHKAKIETY